MLKAIKISKVSFYLFLISFMLIGNIGVVNADGMEKDKKEAKEEEADTPPEPQPAPDRGDDEGMGPYDQLVIQGATVVDGTGAPPDGPKDIIIEDNEIVEVGRSKESYPENTEVIDAEGMYALPGFVDTHGHIGGAQAPNAEYVYKLWLAHGVTTIRDPGSGNGVDWTLNEKMRL